MNWVIPVLICFPFVVAILLALFGRQHGKKRASMIYVAAVTVMVVDAIVVAFWSTRGIVKVYGSHEVSLLILAAEFALMFLVVYLCFKYKKYWIASLSIVQTFLVGWVELFGPELVSDANTPDMLLDRFSVIMTVIVAFIGGMIIIYAAGYMHGYHHHHTEFRDRRTFFFPMLFIFLGAMFGLVLSSNLLWMGFFWEVTSVCSFLLIGYTQTEEAIHNSFRALWMNLLGGLGFAIAIYIAAVQYHTVNLQILVDARAMAPIALLAFAALTKSAQFPFSTWLLGAMVAPTPTSALLHSATMVKAGVYLLIRLAPAMSGTMTGTMVSMVGGFTFFAASCLAISQSDGKKVLAYSTVSNLGLITACAGVGTVETVWAALFLLLFHAVSKSMLFQGVGAIENSLGSRDVEDMTALCMRLPKLAYIMIVGICGMFLAPFGMLISKWAALRSFVDSGDVLLVLFLVYGSATTMFYWTKFLSKIVCFTRTEEPVKDVTRKNEYISLFIHSFLTLLLCVLFPLMSIWLVEPTVAILFSKQSVSVLANSDLIVMVTLLVSVIILPSLFYLMTRNVSGRRSISYMSGANVGDNTHFVDSFGEPKKLVVANWYMNDIFGEHPLLPVSQIISAAFILVMLCLVVLGGM